jgi:hypothetical protein
MFYKTDLLMGAVGGGAFAGARYGDQNQLVDERAREGAVSGIGIFAGASTLAGVGYVGYKTGAFKLAGKGIAGATSTLAPPLARGAAKATAFTGKRLGTWLGGAARDYVGGMASDYRSFRSAAVAAGSSEGMAAVKAGRAFFRPVGAAMAGAAIGAMISDDPEQGALIGGSLGMAAGVAGKYGKTLKTISKIPGAGIVGLLAATAGAAVLGTAMTPPEYQSAAEARDDGTGTVDYRPYQGSIRTRMLNMQAQGDLVFGLNNKRHG